MRRPLDTTAGPIARVVTFLSALFALVAISASDARAQTAPTAQATESAVALRRTFVAEIDSMQGRFLALAEAIPADKYAWRPAPGVRSIGEVFMHVASEYYVYTPMAYGATPSPVVGRGREAFQKFEASASKEDVLKHLREGFAFTKQSIGAIEPATLASQRKLFGRDDLTLTQTSFSMAGDLHEHLGQLVAYARMNGIKPPWSR
jgi:uncharacterized damage-inducible protein DinB